MNRKNLSSISVALFLAIGAFAWVVTGEISHSTEVAADVPQTGTVPEAETFFSVQVADFQASEISNTLRLRGQIESPRKVEVKAEISGIVKSKAALKGKVVAQGETLVQLQVNERQLALEHAKAELLVKQAEKQASDRLLKKKLVSVSQHKQAEAQLLSAQADVKQLELNLQHTRVKAPFAGVLDQLMVEQGSYVGVGDPIGTVIDNSHALIVAQVPQRSISQLTIGMPVSAILVDGKVLNGTLSYIAKSSDTQTRTFRIEAKVTGVDSLTAFGQSAKIRVGLTPVNAQKVPAAILSLSVNGDLQVKGIDNNNLVVTYPVQLIRSDETGAYVRGLPENVTLITVGQGFVADGQQVAPVTTGKGSV